MAVLCQKGFRCDVDAPLSIVIPGRSADVRIVLPDGSVVLSELVNVPPLCTLFCRNCWSLLFITDCKECTNQRLDFALFPF